ncbi:hypothetical protein ACFQ5F_17745 [Kroppenstedtia eburnea]|uniref:hypothetical protein n=1 Tax=Kroppenstedtia eburnea TaxID=714067 RepID=UPI0036352A9A
MNIHYWDFKGAKSPVSALGPGFTGEEISGEQVGRFENGGHRATDGLFCIFPGGQYQPESGESARVPVAFFPLSNILSI